MSYGRKRRSRHDSDVWKGLVAGLAGGLVASWTMNQFQALLSKLSEGDGQGQNRKSSQQKSGQKGGQSKQSAKQMSKEDQPKEDKKEEENDATVKAASAISEGVFDHRLTKREKEVAGPAVHYTLGTLSGGFYGAMAEVTPLVNTGWGLPFGAIFWLTADEAAVPALRLSKAPTEYPLSKHASALAAHLVYGLTTEAMRYAVREVFE